MDAHQSRGIAPAAQLRVSAVIDGSGIVVGCTRRPRPPDVRIRHRHLGRAYDSRFEFVIQADRQNKRRARREAALKFGRFPRNAVSVNYPRPGTEEISRTRHFRAPGTRGNRAGHAASSFLREVVPRSRFPWTARRWSTRPT